MKLSSHCFDYIMLVLAFIAVILGSALMKYPVVRSEYVSIFGIFFICIVLIPVKHATRKHVERR